MSPRRAMSAGMALLPGDRQGASGAGNLSVKENVTLPTVERFFTGGFLRPRREQAHVLEILRQYDVRPVAPPRKLETLSGGNQQKALVAKWLERRPRIFLMHEPTQGVDVKAREEIAGVISQIAADGGRCCCAAASTRTSPASAAGCSSSATGASRASSPATASPRTASSSAATRRSWRHDRVRAQSSRPTARRIPLPGR